MGMKALLAKFPKAERVVQMRIFDREGNVIELEGPITKDEARIIVDKALGPRSSNSETTGEKR